MRYLANSHISKIIDSISIDDYGIPSMVLMERAAYAAAQVIKNEVKKDRLILSVCGSGNNGGDSIAAARILHEEGYNVSVYFTCNENKLSKQSRQQLLIAVKSGISVIYTPEFKDYSVIIDGIFGIGLNRNIEGELFDLIESINKSGADVYSIDIPSGINASTGNVMGIAVKAYATITFGLEKTGIILYPGNDYAGRITVASIGFPNNAIKDADSNEFCYEESDLIMPERKKVSNKGTYGRVLVIAGSEGMCGASYLAAKAAYRTGCGLVKIVAPEANRTILQTQLPEALLAFYSNEIVNNKEYVLNQLSWADAIVIGPGLGTDNTAEFLVKTVIDNSNVPVVVDADAINIIAGSEIYKKAAVIGNLIFTPHLKEMSRLCKCSINEIRDDIVGFTKGKASERIIFALKDARTVVSDGKKSYINISGNDGMATAGSGDVLSGIIASLLAQGMERYSAASLGVYIHGLAGDDSAERIGKRAMIASDIIDSIGNVLFDR